MSFEPVRRAHVYQQIVRQIEEMILRRELAPGDRLPTERELAKSFGVSRTTLRQALAALQAKGLIESHIGSGTYARTESKEFAVARFAYLLEEQHLPLAEALEVRTLLEPQVARLAAERATPALLQDIEVALLQLETAIKETVDRNHKPASSGLLHGADRVIEADSAFHHAVCKAANNQILINILEAIREALRESRRLSLQTISGWQVSLVDHRRIYEAIRDQDPATAAAAMFDHVKNVRDMVVANLVGDGATGRHVSAD